MSLLSLLGFRHPRCCEEAWTELRETRARETALRASLQERSVECRLLRQRIAVLVEERERARDVAASFAFGDGIGDES